MEKALNYDIRRLSPKEQEELLKIELTKKGYSKKEDEIQKKAMAIMRSIQSKKNRVESFFDNEFVKYAKN